MYKYELLSFLQNNIYYFDNIDSSLFEVLRKLKTNKCDITEGNHYLVTPLLKQISDYALLYKTLEDEEKTDLSELYEEFDEVLEFCDCCNTYMELLAYDGYNHPTVINYTNAIRSSLIYTEIFDKLCLLAGDITNVMDIGSNYDEEDEEDENDYDDSDTKVIDDDKKEVINDISRELMSLSVNIDSDIINIIEFLFKHTIHNLLDKEYSKKELLYLLVLYSKNKANAIMLLNTLNVYPDYDEKDNTMIDNNLIFRYIENEKMYPIFNLKIGNALKDFSTIFQKLEELYKFNLDNKIFKNIDYLKEAYFLYESYRYSYLKNQYQEKEILKKCKKL